MWWGEVLEPCSDVGWGSGALQSCGVGSGALQHYGVGSGAFLLVSVVRSVQKAGAPWCCPSEQFTPFHFLLCLGVLQDVVAPARYSGADQEHSVATVSSVGGRGLGEAE